MSEHSVESRNQLIDQLLAEQASFKAANARLRGLLRRSIHCARPGDCIVCDEVRAALAGEEKP